MNNLPIKNSTKKTNSSFMSTITLSLAGMLTLLSSNNVFAEEGLVEVTQAPITPISDSIPATPLESIELPFPSELRIMGNEGWVQLNFNVDKTGAVKNPIVEASVGGPAFEKAAFNAVKELKFSPATYKGKPVEQNISGEVVEFLLEQTFEGIDTGFGTAYTEMLSLFQTPNSPEATAALEALSKSQDLTMIELSMLEVMYAYQAAHAGDQVKQLEHLRNATVFDGSYLPKEMLSSALQTRYALAVKHSLFHEAYYAYNLLEKTDPTNDKLNSLAMSLVTMQNAIESGQLIRVAGKITNKGYFTYTPIRRTFAFDAADEGISGFEPRCERNNKRFEVNTQNEWKIPDSWGACSVVVYGTPGSSFALLELGAQSE